MTNQFKLTMTTAAILALSSAAAIADPVSLPHTFVSGNKAVASEVNKNFETLRDGINAHDTGKQNRVSGICPEGSSIRVINQDGTVACQVDNVSAGGGISSVAGGANSGLTTNTAGGTVTLNTDKTVLQARISQNCGVGSAIRSINMDGTVICDSGTQTSPPKIVSTPSDTWATVPTTAASIISLAFTAPKAGNVLVTATGSITIESTGTTNGYYCLDLSIVQNDVGGCTPMAGSKSAIRSYIPSNFSTLTGSTYGSPFTMQEVYPVTTGQSITIYINGATSGLKNTYLFHPTITALFIPN